MLSLYEILKASKTGIAPDMWTALAGMNWGGADSGHEVKELTGIPPLSFTADGTPLLDYLISGNTVQNGTPTPSNPVDVNGVGVRTENLFDPNFTRYEYAITDAAKIVPYSGGAVYILPVENGETYTIKIHALASVRILRMAFYDYETPINNDYVYNIIKIENTEQPQLTLVNGGNHPYLIVQVAGEFIDNYGTNSFMLNTGSTAKPYEPYGYKIPISNSQQTTNIDLGSTQTVRQIYKLVLTGNEEWHIQSTNQYGITNYYTYLSKDDTCISGQTLSYCTHYKQQQSLISNTKTIGFLLSGNIYSSMIYIREIAADYADVTAFKAYLAAQHAAGTPVTIWYVLATPQTVTVNEPLMKIGDYADTLSMEQAGMQIPTLHGNTVIDIETTPKPSQMYIKYQQ